MNKTSFLLELVTARKVLIASALIALLALSTAFQLLPVIPRASASGPATSNLLIKIYLDPVQEVNALGKGDIDINDWPLSKTFITTYASDPKITMNEYAGIDMFQIDMNNQLWPTGPIPSPRTGAKNGFFNPAGVRDIAALHFRRAIAHLSNKAKYTTTFLGGYGYVIETIMPKPLEGWTDYSTLTNDTADLLDPWSPGMGGYLYGYDRDKAATEFELGGFADWDGDTYREWNKNYPNAWRGAQDTEELPNMKLWARLDDPNRRQAGMDLYQEMLGRGIPAASGAGQPGLEIRIAERPSCFAAAMVNYDYNIYTGNWGDDFELSWWPDFLYDLYHSSTGQYKFANNYVGFANLEFDDSAYSIKAGLEPSVIRKAAINAQWIIAKYVGAIPLWSSKAVKGYRYGWQDVVNQADIGTDNVYSFDLMNWNPSLGGTRNGDPDTIAYGFKSDISSLNVFTSKSRWDRKVLDQTYDYLVDYNPYNIVEPENGSVYFRWPKFYTVPLGQGFGLGVNLTMGIVPRNLPGGSGTITAGDVAFAINEILVPGSKLALGLGKSVPACAVAQFIVDHFKEYTIGGAPCYALTNSEDKSVGFLDVRISWEITALGLLIETVQEKIDDFVSEQTGKVWKEGWKWLKTNAPFLAEAIDKGLRALRKVPLVGKRIWKEAVEVFGLEGSLSSYEPWIVDLDGNGIVDLREDGSGPWNFVTYATGQSVSLTANTNYYRTSTEVLDLINTDFHFIGNVNYEGGYGDDHGWYTPDRKIDLIGDLFRIADSLGTTVLDPWGPSRGQYNWDADLNRDDVVNIIDLATAGANYNKKQG